MAGEIIDTPWDVFEEESYILHVRSRMTEGLYSMMCRSNDFYRGRVRSRMMEDLYSTEYRSNGYYRGRMWRWYACKVERRYSGHGHMQLAVRRAPRRRLLFCLHVAFNFVFHAYLITSPLPRRSVPSSSPSWCTASRKPVRLCGMTYSRSRRLAMAEDELAVVDGTSSPGSACVGNWLQLGIAAAASSQWDMLICFRYYAVSLSLPLKPEA